MVKPKHPADGDDKEENVPFKTELGTFEPKPKNILS